MLESVQWSWIHNLTVQPASKSHWFYLALGPFTTCHVWHLQTPVLFLFASHTLLVPSTILNIQVSRRHTVPSLTLCASALAILPGQLLVIPSSLSKHVFPSKKLFLTPISCESPQSPELSLSWHLLYCNS